MLQLVGWPQTKLKSQERFIIFGILKYYFQEQSFQKLFALGSVFSPGLTLSAEWGSNLSAPNLSHRETLGRTCGNLWSRGHEAEGVRAGRKNHFQDFPWPLQIFIVENWKAPVTLKDGNWSLQKLGQSWGQAWRSKSPCLKERMPKCSCALLCAPGWKTLK